MLDFRHALWGTEYGDFDIRFRHANKSLSILNERREREGLKMIFAPKCNFTNRIVRLGQEDDRISDWLIRTTDDADGGIVNSRDQGVAFFTADCPIVAVHELISNRLAVLHASFRCLVPEKRKKHRERSIIKVLFEDYKFDTDNSKVFFGYGIGPCCYGAEHWPEINDPTIDLPIGKVTRCLRRINQRSIDLYKLIYNQLIEMKVNRGNISCDLTCTACAGLVRPKYWSHCRDAAISGRNIALAWTEIYTPR